MKHTEASSHPPANGRGDHWKNTIMHFTQTTAVLFLPEFISEASNMVRLKFMQWSMQSTEHFSNKTISFYMTVSTEK